MTNQTEVEMLAESFINGNISYVVNEIGQQRGDLAALVAVGVYTNLVEYSQGVADSFHRCLARHAG